MRAGVAAATLIAGAALALPAGALANQPHARAGGSPAASGWSPARMAAALPLELVRGPGGTELRRSRQVPYMSFEVPDPTTSPNPTNGRLFGHIDRLGDYSCSATVLDTTNGRVIFTAGHCVFDPQVGRFASQLTFVPAYTDGQMPFGAWSWTRLVTTRPWVFDANSNFDYAAIKLAKLNGSPIESVVGGRVLKTNILRDQPYTAFGYPANLAGGERMWACASEYAGRDPRPFRVGKAASAMGCDMTAGASGGGWVNGAGRLVSVSSFGYRNQPNVLYGPYLTVAARKVVRRIAR